MLLSSVVLLLTVSSVIAAPEWPIPIPESLLPDHKDQQTFGVSVQKPENVRLIQTTEDQYEWTGDIEQLLREGVRLMDVARSL